MTPTVRDIIDATCAHYLIKTSDLLGPVRQQHLVDARHAAFWVIRKLTNMSATATGHRFGGRDHTTVLHGLKKLDREMSVEHAGGIAAITVGAMQRANRRVSTAPKFTPMSSRKFKIAAQ